LSQLAGWPDCAVLGYELTIQRINQLTPNEVGQLAGWPVESVAGWPVELFWVYQLTIQPFNQLTKRLFPPCALTVKGVPN